MTEVDLSKTPPSGADLSSLAPPASGEATQAVAPASPANDGAGEVALPDEATQARAYLTAHMNDISDLWMLLGRPVLDVDQLEQHLDEASDADIVELAKRLDRYLEGSAAVPAWLRRALGRMYGVITDIKAEGGL